ncbi:hypothetical protein HU200_010562 [Digitaria exilis]|uniref:Agenet domain-containing protein n=1 Tax=Digitaria exilis TaxID=1010633 RepID=A0A835FHR4_9POAL|nr:hypothetical protein HU200_010562 [Digitaria exilis]
MPRGRPRRRARASTEPGDEAAAVEEEPALFPLGALVEVRSDDIGFAGSFYEATVVGYQGDGLDYVVAYSTLVRSKDGSSPLREPAAATDVRPRPPPAPPRQFAVHEMVEAFHNEGWWAGVVCAVPVPPDLETAPRPPRRVYKVCFPTSRELLEFEEAALRPNRVFQGGRWVSAAEAGNGMPLLRDGSQVEVSRSAKTFGKYWSPAIILKVIGATSFLIQYRNVREDGEQLTEILDSQYIRPTRNIIRMDSKYRFPPSSHVEVFHEGSWWTGAVLEVLDNESTKKYVIKIKNKETDVDDVECVDLLTVDHTQLRPKYNWYHGKWVRSLPEKPANRRPQLTPHKSPISATLASCNDIVDLVPLAPCNDSEQIRDEPGSFLKKKVSDEDVILKQVSPFSSKKQVSPELLVCNGNDQINCMPSYFPEEVVKQQNTVLSFESHLKVPSQKSVTGFCNLKYDPNLSLSGQLELSSSQMLSMPSLPHTGQLQASLFGAFGQLRPLPQGPLFGMQSHIIDFGSIVGSAKTFTDQRKQTNDKGHNLMTGSKQNLKFGSFSQTALPTKRLFAGQGKQAYSEGHCLMTGSKQNINSGSFSGTYLSRKRLKESVSPQTPELLGGTPKIMLKRKRLAGKKVKGGTKLAAISEESTELNNDDDNDLPKNVDLGSVLHSEGNIVTCTDPRRLKDDKGSQEISVFLRESSVADEIIPTGVPIGADTFHQEDCIRGAQHGATKVSVLIEESALSITSTLDNSSQAHVFSSYYSTRCENKAANAEKSATIMEQGTCEEFCQQSSISADDANVHLLPSVESSENTRGKDCMEAMMECVGSCVPTENDSIMGGVVPNLLLSSENCEVSKRYGMSKAVHQENICHIPDTKQASATGLSSAISLPTLNDLTDHEQHGVSQNSLAMVEFAAEGSQSIKNSGITPFSSISMSNSTEAEQGDTLIDPKDSERMPVPKYVPSRTQGTCLSLLQRSRDVHESIMSYPPTEPLAIGSVPFMKTSPMWEQIEAMEVFRNMPQRPNFYKFKQHVPEFREGMALGLMLSFANMAESIRRLSIHDDDALFEEKMKGLSSLEADGFDVRLLRSRLETLLHIRNGTAGFQGAIRDLGKKISHIEADDRHLGTQIGILNMTVRQLELQAYFFRCIMRSAISLKVNYASEIVGLETEAGTLEASYLSAEQRFSSAAAAPW